MRRIIQIKFILPLFLLLISSLVIAQKPLKQTTEKEINLQGVFIEGIKEKLLGNNEEAIALFVQVLTEQPKNDAALYELGQLYKKTGDRLKARNHAKKAVILSPENVWYSTFYAEILAEDAEYEQAAEIYKNLVTRYPNQQEYYYEWAYMLIKAEKPNQAIKVYDNLEKIIGVNERTSKRKYSLYLLEGKAKKAEGELVKLVKEYPYEVAFHQLLAEYYEQNGKEAKAKKVYENILEIAPDDPVANLALAETFKLNGEEEKYLNAIVGLFKNPEVNIDLKIRELVPYIRKMPELKNKPSIQKKLFNLGKILTETHPDEAKAYSVYGDLLYHANENEKALAVYQSTLKRDKSVFVVWEQVLYILLDMKDGKQLSKLSEEAMDVFPNQATVYYMNGIAQGMLGKHKDAIDILDQSYMMAGRNKSLKSSIYSAMGVSYHALKQYDKSENAFKESLKINPRFAEALNAYSYSLCERGVDLERARQMSSNAIQLVENNPDYEATYGWIFYKSNDFTKAERWLKMAISNGGNSNPNTLEHYGDVLFQLDKVDEAVSYWQKAQENGSTSPLLNKKIIDKKLYE
jgi:tetratricopeptide (TPR) repeat protein